MKQAIFTGDFNFSSRVENQGYAIKPSNKPQTFPDEVIDAAIKAGVAHIPTKDAKGKATSS